MIMPRRRRSKKWISWLIILILLIAAGVVCYLVWNSYFNDSKMDGQGGTEVSSEVKEETGTTDGNEEVEDDEKKVKQYEGDDPNNAEELSGAVTFAGVVDEKVMIRANIDQYLGDGSCKLSLMNGESVAYEETTRIVSAASTATCEGFDISLDGISEGSYKIIIKIEANGKNGTIEGTLDI